MTTIIEHQQGLNLGRRYELYEFDLTKFGLDYIRVFEGDEGGDNEVYFDGVPYSPYPIQTSGWKISAQGQLARPRFAVANTSGIFTPMIENHKGLARAIVYRTVTYDRFLDGGVDADPTQHDPIEMYEINRVMNAGKISGVESVQWELITPPDKPIAKISKIQIIKGPCQRSYRTFDAANNQFINGSCPYRGSATFDEDDIASDNANDECSQTTAGCKIRYGEGNKIPYLAFPSVGQLRR